MKAMGIGHLRVPGITGRRQIRRVRVLAVLAGAVAVWAAVALGAVGSGGVIPAARAVVPAAVSWGKAIEVPGLAALNTSGGAGVSSVSCASAGNCAAGGGYTDGERDGQGYVADERDGVWGPAAGVPGLAALNAGGGAGVSSVSCGSAGNCAAGGDYTDSRGNLHGFVADERDGVWGLAAAVSGTGTRYSEVYSVSCASAGNCTAGGYYVDQHGYSQGFVADERAGVWAKATGVPGLAALHKRGGSAKVYSVSCASAGNCAAGGDYHYDHQHQGFVATERAGVWGKAIAVPGLRALNTGGWVEVTSVSCGAAGSCAAGGYYRTRYNQDQGFVAVEKNGRWDTAIAVPGLRALNTGGFAHVWSVSCGAAGSCAAGGDYGDEHGKIYGFVAAERHGRWGKAIEVPGLAALNTGKDAGVLSVSCGAAGNCAAGGDYTGGGKPGPPYHGQAFVAVERHGRWAKAIEVPGLAALNKGGIAEVDSVSCAPAGTCAAGGYYTDAPDNFQGFVVSQSG